MDVVAGQVCEGGGDTPWVLPLQALSTRAVWGLTGTPPVHQVGLRTDLALTRRRRLSRPATLWGNSQTAHATRESATGARNAPSGPEDECARLKQASSDETVMRETGAALARKALSCTGAYNQPC